MHENPYESVSVTSQPTPSESGEPRAGFGLRLLAYLVDVLPITFAIAAICFVFFGFGTSFRDYADDPQNLTARAEFLKKRNQVRDLSFLTYIIYAALLESSPLQGTLGKKLFGLRVTDMYGNRLTIGRAMGRNFSKVISGAVCGLGFLWAIWSPTSQAWHDSIAKTIVVKPTR